MLSSCSNTNQTKENEEKVSSSSHGDMSNQEESITLILYFGDNNSQIIQCSDTTLIYGVGNVKVADEISGNDITWNLSYPKIERCLNSSQQKVVKTAVSKLSADTCYINPNVAKDNVEYVLYVNNRKVASGYEAFIDSFPKHIQDIIKELLLMASPLYPIHGKA